MRLKQVLLLLIVVAVIVTGGLFFTKNQKESDTAISSQAGTESQSSDALLSLLSSASQVSRWQVGYDYRYTTSFSSGLFIETSEAPSMGFQLTGTWKVTPIEASGTSLMLHVRFENTLYKMTMETNAPATQVEDAEKAAGRNLSIPYFISLNANGRVTDIRLGADATHVTQSLLKSFSGMIQFVAPGGPPQGTWETRESDATGEYRASYESKKADSFVKKKLSYLRVGARATQNDFQDRNAATITLSANVLASQFAFDFAGNGPMTTLIGKEKIEVKGSDVFSSGRSDSSLSMTLHKVSLSDMSDGKRAGLISKARSLEAIALDSPPSRKTRRKIIDEQKIAGMDFKTILQVYDENPGQSRAERDKRYRAFLGLEALLRQNPDAVNSAVDYIGKGGPHTADMIRALGYAGSETSQQALIDMFNPISQDIKAQRTIFGVMHNADDPSAANVAFHKKYLTDKTFGDIAQLGLGAMVKNLRSSGERGDMAEDALDALIEVLETAESEEKILLALKALSNSGHPRLLELTRPYLRSRNIEIRKTAIDTLRLIPGGEIDLMIIDVALTDPNIYVREKAVFVLGERQISPLIVSGIERILKQEPKPRVQYAAVGVLTKNTLGDDMVIPALKWVVENISDKKSVALAKKRLKMM
ncbi:MAG: hypothetical protein JXR76_11270 [Deltaproteobacteria bacterium]|nr:hypothetical protein [Deltaproteobacteria bacterium]